MLDPELAVCAVARHRRDDTSKIRAVNFDVLHPRFGQSSKLLAEGSVACAAARGGRHDHCVVPQPEPSPACFARAGHQVGHGLLPRQRSFIRLVWELYNILR